MCSNETINLHAQLSDNNAARGTNQQQWEQQQQQHQQHCIIKSWHLTNEPYLNPIIRPTLHPFLISVIPLNTFGKVKYCTASRRTHTYAHTHTHMQIEGTSNGCNKSKSQRDLSISSDSITPLSRIQQFRSLHSNQQSQQRENPSTFPLTDPQAVSPPSFFRVFFFMANCQRRRNF